MRKTDGSGGRTPRSAGSGVVVKHARLRADRGSYCHAGSGTASTRPKAFRRFRLAVLLVTAFAVGVIPIDGVTGAWDIPEDPQKKHIGVRLKEGPVQEDNDWNPKTPSQDNVSPMKKKISPGRKWKGSEVREDNDWNSKTPSQPLRSRELPIDSKDRAGGRRD